MAAAAARKIITKRFGSSSSSRCLFATIGSSHGYGLPEVRKPMPAPDGGGWSLPDLMVPLREKEQLRAKAATLPALTLRQVDLEWAHMLADGWASPLAGFMDEAEYIQCLHLGSLRLDRSTVINMSIPIVLPITWDDVCAIKTKYSPYLATYDVALLKPSGEIFAILRGEPYKYDKQDMVIRTWGTRALQSPYVKEVIGPAGDWLIGGQLKVLEPITYNDGLDHYRISPMQLRKQFKRLNADAVYAFQLRGPFHNGHAEYINKVRKHLLGMGYINPILLLHPLGGYTEPHGLPLAVLMEQYSKVLEDGILDPTTTVLAIFPSPMNYLGQAEVQWHAKARINAGVNFFIIDEPAGIDSSSMYYLEHGETIFHFAPGLDKIYQFPYWQTAYDKEEKKMVFAEPERGDNLLFISEAEMQRDAINGENPPHGFMCQSGWKVLADYYRNPKTEESAHL